MAKKAKVAVTKKTSGTKNNENAKSTARKKAKQTLAESEGIFLNVDEILDGTDADQHDHILSAHNGLFRHP